MMADWNPGLYRQFEAERTRPARDLLAQVPLDRAAHAVDLGCGPGNSTELLAERFAGADILGIDTSAAMLASARARLPACRFEAADIAAWQPDTPPDLIYANAALHWVPDHETLMPRLLDAAAPGGVLAVQMPDNAAEPSHRLMRVVAAEAPFAAALGALSDGRAGILTAAAYYDLLAPRAATVEIWRTIYHHPLESPAAIVAWLSSTGLRPFLAPLGEAERAAFLARFEERIAEAYPERADGKRLLTFPRLFIVARRAG